MFTCYNFHKLYLKQILTRNNQTSIVEKDTDIFFYIMKIVYD